MGYAHVENLYREEAQTILMFKECYALEKIHGESAWLYWKDGEIRFHTGSVNHETFVALFDKTKLEEHAKETGLAEFTIYGEAYGGRMQGMAHTYGPNLKFVAFEVNIDRCWLSVPQAEDFVKGFGLEFVSYKKIPTTIEAIDAERDAPSVQTVRNGITEPKMREGIVLRPLIEMTKNNGTRIMAKHKRDEFRETKTPRTIDPAKVQIIADAQKATDEFCTEMRLGHVLDKLGPGIGIESMSVVIKAMHEDIFREGSGELLDSKETRKAISCRTAQMFKRRLQATLHKLPGTDDVAPIEKPKAE